MEIKNIKVAPRQVFIMRGISGAGKSTFIKKFKEYHPDVTISVSSADFYFMQDGKYNFDRNQLPQAHGSCKDSFRKAITANVAIVIVDNTNLKYQEMKPYVEMAEAAGYNWNVIQVDSPLSTILIRQQTCKNIGEDTILKMFEKMKSAIFELDVKKRFIYINGAAAAEE